ncbi:MAG: hypothetical protein PHT40_01075 [Patescibacteria group bacterium]|nr:hypothetical protein [Patescibacteria group bacterium]
MRLPNFFTSDKFKTKVIVVLGCVALFEGLTIGGVELLRVAIGAIFCYFGFDMIRNPRKVNQAIEEGKRKRKN